MVYSTGRFVGLVLPQRLLAVLLEEHDEDLAPERNAAPCHDPAETISARRTSVESVPRRAGHRLPWLLLGLAGAFVAAGIVGGFEAQLEQYVLIAFFVPGVVYLADAVGTQTEALVIRGLSVGVGLRRVAEPETLTGALVGLLLAAITHPVVWWSGATRGSARRSRWRCCSPVPSPSRSRWPPWLLNRLGVDPAYGAGPLATVVQTSCR